MEPLSLASPALAGGFLTMVPPGKPSKWGYKQVIAGEDAKRWWMESPPTPWHSENTTSNIFSLIIEPRIPQGRSVWCEVLRGWVRSRNRTPGLQPPPPHPRMLHSWLQGCTWVSWFETCPLSASSSSVSALRKKPRVGGSAWRWEGTSTQAPLLCHLPSPQCPTWPDFPKHTDCSCLFTAPFLHLGLMLGASFRWTHLLPLASPAPSSASLTPSCDCEALTSASSSAPTPKKSLPVLCLHYPTWGCSNLPVGYLQFTTSTKNTA